MAKVLVLFYSLYSHTYRLAEAVHEGAGSVDGAASTLKRVQELIPAEQLEAIGALGAQQLWAHVPVAQPTDLLDYDAIIVGAPTRFGNMPAQMRYFWDQTTEMWFQGKLIGKLGSVF